MPPPAPKLGSACKIQAATFPGVPGDGKTVGWEEECSADVGESMPMLSALFSLSTKMLENPATTLLALASVYTMDCFPPFAVYQDFSLRRLDSSRSLLHSPRLPFPWVLSMSALVINKPSPAYSPVYNSVYKICFVQESYIYLFAI